MQGRCAISGMLEKCAVAAIQRRCAVSGMLGKGAVAGIQRRCSLSGMLEKVCRSWDTDRWNTINDDSYIGV
jgi:hypothetical protein